MLYDRNLKIYLLVFSIIGLNSMCTLPLDLKFEFEIEFMLNSSLCSCLELTTP